MLTLSWFSYSIIATILFGFSMTLYKLPQMNGHSRFATAFWSLLTSFILSLIFFHSYFVVASFELMFTAFLWGLAFVCLMLLQMHSLKYADTGAIFPITTTGSLVITVLTGLLVFGETLTILQFMGIALAVFTVFFFLRSGRHIKYSIFIVNILAIIIGVSVLAKIIFKFAADSFDIQTFLIYQYFFATLIALLVFFIFHKRKWSENIFSGSLKIGLMIGIFGFFGAYAWLTALTKGPFAIIMSIHSFYIFVVAGVGYFLLKEKITKQKTFLLIFAIISVILMRLG